MGGKRQKGVTMNRARKKKVFQAEVAPVVIGDTTGTTEPCPAGPAGPEPSQPPPSPPVPEEDNLQSYVSEIDMLVERRQQAFIKQEQRPDALEQDGRHLLQQPRALAVGFGEK